MIKATILPCGSIIEEKGEKSPKLSSSQSVCEKFLKSTCNVIFGYKITHISYEGIITEAICHLPPSKVSPFLIRKFKLHPRLNAEGVYEPSLYQFRFSKLDWIF